MKKKEKEQWPLPGLLSGRMLPLQLLSRCWTTHFLPTGPWYLLSCCPDLDSGQGVSMWCGGNEQTHMDYRSPVGGKGTAWLLSKWERAPTPAWTGFYCFSGYITLRMVLIYYAQVCFRWLPFTDNKGKNVANYFKEKKVCKSRGKVVELVTLHTWEVWHNFRNLKIVSKRLLCQSRVREFYQKQVS